MGIINVLSFELANLIAAGEVVDRPCSVIKELLENAIDSGADRICVEIQNGGISYMRVTDNGCGISREDLPTAIRRHATSKIKSAEDLDGIMTLGFRGEALAAIAAVSEMRIVSKTKDADTGNMMFVKAGNVISITDRPMMNGTSVIVENLFANVPARRKFLKKDQTEAIAVGAMVEKIALSHPNISFKYIVDGNVRLDTVGDGELFNTIYSIFGRDFASRLIKVQTASDGISVWGYVSRPDNVRGNRNYQNFYINGRYVKTKTALAAIEQAYVSYIPSDKYAACVLFIEINPKTVDVNIHPAKLEVKFSDERPVFDALYHCVRDALETNTERPSISLTRTQKLSDRQTPIEETRRESLAKRQLQSELYVARPAVSTAAVSSAQAVQSAPQKTAASAPAETQTGDKFINITARDYLYEYTRRRRRGAAKNAPPPKQVDYDREKLEAALQKMTAGLPPLKSEPERLSTEPISKRASAPTPEPARISTEPKSLAYRIVGEVFNSYIIVECEDKMLLIDKHAAHERIIFEKLRAGMKNEVGRTTQLLMLPIEVMLTSEEIRIIEEYRGEVEAVGFGFTAGRFTLSVTEIPDGIASEAVPAMLEAIAERIKESTGGARLARDAVFERALYQASCKAAIKAGREYPREYGEWVVEQLMKLPDITVCPHGRPVAIELTHKNLDNQFERS